MKQDKTSTQRFIEDNLSWFIDGVQEFEVAFDLKPSHIQVNEEAVKNGNLIRYINQQTGEPTETYYTEDYNPGKRKSTGIIYNKAEKNKHDKKGKEEQNTPYKTRIEFRLCRNNCEYLNLDNFNSDSSIDDVIKQYTPLLAIKYHNFFEGNIDLHVPKSYKHLKRIVKEAKEGKQRYRGPLKKTETLPKRKDKAGKEQMRQMVKRAFLEEMKSGENT